MSKKTLNSSQLMVGLLFVAAGVLLMLGTRGIIQDLRRFWPLLLIAGGIIKLRSPNSDSRVGSWVLIAGGSFFLMANLGLVTLSARDLVALVIILAGGSLVWRAVTRSPDLPEDATLRVNDVGILGGVERTCSTQDFQGGELTAIMGGVEIDLREASISNPPAVLEIFALWGGIQLKVPEDWSVSVETRPVMGGVVDKTRPPRGGSDKKLVLTGYAVMGGVEIRN